MPSARFFSGDNRSPVGRNSAAQHGALAGEGSDVDSAFDVPHPQRMVSRGRDGAAAIGCYRHRIDQARMAFERAHRLAAFQIPHPQRLVGRGRDGAAAIGRYATAVTQSVWPSRMRTISPLSESHTSSAPVSEPHMAHRPSGVTANGADQVGMACESAHRLAALQVPHPQRTVSRGRDGAAPVRRYGYGTNQIPYGLREYALSGHSPSPTPAAYGQPMPRRRGAHRALRLRR